MNEAKIAPLRGVGSTTPTRRDSRPTLASPRPRSAHVERLIALARTVALRHHGGVTLLPFAEPSIIEVGLASGGEVQLTVRDGSTRAFAAPGAQCDWLALINLMRELNEGASRLAAEVA